MVAIIFAFLSIWVMIDSYRLGLQSFRNPGPGLFPFLAGVLLAILVLPLVVRRLRGWRNKDEKETRTTAAYHWKMIAAMAALVGYFMFMDKLGFVVTSFLFLGSLFWIANPRRWILVSSFSLATVALTYVIFDVLLKIPFPPGIFR
jgi:putative tricarboxylic transport membrane protein